MVHVWNWKKSPMPNEYYGILKISLKTAGAKGRNFPCLPIIDHY